jgi:CBS-domain-containing membrane protein
MRVQDVMTNGVKTIAPTVAAEDAWNVMRLNGRSIGCLVVVESDRAIGIVTVSDLLELVGRGLDRGAAITERRTLNHRAPHRKSKGVVAAW